jgi:hypothetical protein
VDTALAFLATIVSLRLAAELIRRRRRGAGADLVLWAASLAAFAFASAALAWGSAAGWDERAFRAYYLFGGLLTAPLLGAGSLLRAGWRPARAVALAYTGLAVGIAISEPVHTAFDGAIPDAQDHLDLFPARILAIAGNSIGTLAVVAVCVWTFRRRPAGNALLLAGVGVAALGSALSGLGVGESAISFALASVLLYAGAAQPRERSQSPPTV